MLQIIKRKGGFSKQSMDKKGYYFREEQATYAPVE